jgi:hypothetical protein
VAIVHRHILFQSIKQLENRLENEKRAARDQISHLLAKEKSDRLYQWIIRQSLGLNKDLPLGDDTHLQLNDYHPLSYLPPLLPISYRNKSVLEFAITRKAKTKQSIFVKNFSTKISLKIALLDRSETQF